MNRALLLLPLALPLLGCPTNDPNEGIAIGNLKGKSRKGSHWAPPP